MVPECIINTFFVIGRRHELFHEKTNIYYVDYLPYISKFHLHPIHQQMDLILSQIHNNQSNTKSTPHSDGAKSSAAYHHI